MNIGQYLRQHVIGHEFACCDPHSARDRHVTARRYRRKFSRSLCHCAGGGQDRLTGLRQLEALGLALKQGHAQLRLNRLDLAAKRGLAGTGRARGSREGAVLCHRQKRLNQ